jgi:hypothetical protein
MANDEHVALLKKGVKAWNAWRDENPDIRRDLSEANLHQGGEPQRGEPERDDPHGVRSRCSRPTAATPKHSSVMPARDCSE